MADICLDVSVLAPPEPMERILDALDGMRAPDRLAVLIDREPHPLLRLLNRNNYRYAIEHRPDGKYDLLIWPAA